MNEKKTKTLKGWGPIKYVLIENVPVRYSEKYGEIIDISSSEIERKIAIAIIEHRVPIKGGELKLLKSAMGISFEDLGRTIGVSKNSLVKWCKETDQRLSIPYEIAIRVYVAERFGIKLNATLDDLIANDQAKEISLKAA